MWPRISKLVHTAFVNQGFFNGYSSEICSENTSIVVEGRSPRNLTEKSRRVGDAAANMSVRGWRLSP